MTGIWGARAERAQRELDAKFWNEDIEMYNIRTPCPDGACNTIFHYWWMAHAVETLTDGWNRTGAAVYRTRLASLHRGLLRRNGGAWPNNLYDDMEWMAIGWLRAYQATGDESFKAAALELWKDIQTGWNDHVGGGIAWQKTQLDYKNTPANAPAAILAARLYAMFGDEDDLAWAKRIYDWVKRTLVDPRSGFVWDGANRLGDGNIDKDWKFTYCQGVYIGAAVELYRLTGDGAYLEDAARTWRAAVAELAEERTGLFPAEGKGDAGLFKGILVRYAGELALTASDGLDIAGVIGANAASLWDHAVDGERALFGERWDVRTSGDVELSTQLSGIILLETMSALEAAGRIRQAEGA